MLMLTNEDELISFCTYSERDDIQPTALTPWIGFIYTFPQYRGHRYVGKLFQKIEELAKVENVHDIFISTNHTGLYEKYGCEFYQMMNDIHGEASRVYRKHIESSVNMKEIETEQELRDVLEMCYDILGTDNEELYGYDAWHKRFKDGLQPLVFAKKDGKIVSAVLGRAENQESLVIGFAACHEDYRRQGITKDLLYYFEDLARNKGFKYITLGSKEDEFYEKCGYKVIFQVHGQNIFQKVLCKD